MLTVAALYLSVMVSVNAGIAEFVLFLKNNSFVLNS